MEYTYYKFKMAVPVIGKRTDASIIKEIRHTGVHLRRMGLATHSIRDSDATIPFYVGVRCATRVIAISK